jgi:lysylphosphatidylglycerol synthetase-like protein (DUF2156 family)
VDKYQTILSKEAPPALSEIQGFSPEGKEFFINPDTRGTSTFTDHWFFLEAIPSWISYLVSFSVGIAILLIVVSGVMLMVHPEIESTKEKAYKTITWSLIGLVIIVLPYSIVSLIDNLPFKGINPDTNIEINEYNSIKTNVIDNLAQGDLRSEIIPQIIQIILQIMGTISLVLFLYAGFLLVMRDGEEEKVTKAKNLMMYSLLGVIIALLSYIIVEGVIQLNFEKG